MDSFYTSEVAWIFNPTFFESLDLIFFRPEFFVFSDFEMQKTRLGDRSHQFIEAVKPSSDLIQQVNATQNTAGQKRFGSNGYANGSVNKKQKVLEESDIKAMKAFAQAKKIESLNVDKLKDFLRAAGLSVTGKKKAELVVDVYKYCG